MDRLAFVLTVKAQSYRTQDEVWRWANQSAQGEVIIFCQDLNLEVSEATFLSQTCVQ